METLQRGSIIELEITALTSEGSGLGRVGGRVVFVPNTAPGDTAMVRITQEKKNYAQGELVSLSTRSQNRVENDCPYFPLCGGCNFRHIPYAVECQHKGDTLVNNLARIGKLTPELEGFLPAPETLRYRNNVQIPLAEKNGVVTFGFFAAQSRQSIPMEDCLLQPPEFTALAKVLCDFMNQRSIPAYHPQTHQGLVRHLYLRRGETTKELMVVLVINGKDFPHWQELLEQMQKIVPITTLLLNHNTQKVGLVTGTKYTLLFGDGYLHDRLAGVRLRLSPEAFYQVNHGAAERLYEQAMVYASPTEQDILLDLYCGVGAIGLSMAHRVSEVIGVEIVPQAVEDARYNATLNAITNSRFIQGDATKAVQIMQKENRLPSIVLLDPPRKGADQAGLDAIVAMAPEKIVYISCDSATLARDCGYLAGQGYQGTRGRGVDLFPRTKHQESVVLLERKPSE